MSRLLCAGFQRLKKDKCFWTGILTMFGFGVLVILNNRGLLNEGSGINRQYSLDLFLCGYIQIIGIVCSVFCGLFIGTEYSDGTVRNKLVVGHLRRDIYISNYIISLAASLAMSLSYIAAVLIFGIPAFGGLQSDAGDMALLLMQSVLIIMAFTAIFTMMAMLNQNKAVSSVSCIIMAFGLIMAANIIESRLSAPEFYSEYALSEDGSLEESEPKPNPKYLTGEKRIAFEFMYDALPTGQAIQVCCFELGRMQRKILCSAAITVFATLAGLCVFRKKDIK